MPDKRMKRGAALRLVCMLTAGPLLVGCGATEPPIAAEPQPPAQTQAGEPVGVPTNATIGAAGGTLASSDGRLTITVPPGAMAAGTVVTIQPITATAPGALGSGYRLSPEGVTFTQPVSLTFSYPADQGGATDPQSLRVATQDENGYWSVMPATHDAAQRRLIVTTTHFSDWSSVAGLQLAPASATVEINKQLQLRLTYCGLGLFDENNQRLLLQCIDPTALVARNWSVNGTPGGNSTVGTVAGAQGQATYTAPSSVPGQNPVAVSTQATLPAALGGASYTLVSNVTVVDELAGYTGSINGQTVVTVGNQTGFHELSATLTFTRNARLSIGGDVWYDGTGTAVVRARPFGCSGEGSGSAPVQAASLVLHTSGPLAGTYTISVSATATMTVTCGDPPALVSAPIVGAAGAGGSDICPSVLIGSDPSRLTGSWSCNVSQGARQTANWTFVKSAGGQVIRRPY